MINSKKTHIAIFGDNKFGCLQLIVYGWLKRMKILVFYPGIPPRIKFMLGRLFFIRKYMKQSISEYKTNVGIYKGVAYKINQEAIDLTLEFLKQNIKNNNKLVFYYNNIFSTNKFEAYIKKMISSQIFIFLNELYFVRLFNMGEREILIIKNPVNEFVVAYMQDNYKVKYRIKWIRPLWGSAFLFGYYAWLFTELLKRGIIINKPKKEYKLSKEAAYGFSLKTLRDDILIDNNKFKKGDILLLGFLKGGDRVEAFKEAKERGFDTVSVPDLKININKNIFGLLYCYIFVPIKVYLQLFFRRQLHFFYYIFLFHQRCFSFEILMGFYNIKYHISNEDWGGVEETIIFNKYKTKNTIFHWCDLVAYRTYNHAFPAHNIYFTWGNIYRAYHADNSFVDEKINIGCIYKERYNIAVKNKERLQDEIDNLKKERKTVAFFDTSFDNLLHLNGCFFMEYLNIVKEFCEKNQEINILLKPKSSQKVVLSQLLGDGAAYKYKEILQDLASYENFIYLDCMRWSAEEVIAISDVCISMGVSSPVTIALICGKNGLYYDPTENRCHPFTQKYVNKIVFEDKVGLFNQIDNILKGRFNCREVISDKEIRDYDAFGDDNALQRLRDNLYQLTTLS